jgi:hypothetical protein
MPLITALLAFALLQAATAHAAGPPDTVVVFKTGVGPAQRAEHAATHAAAGSVTHVDIGDFHAYTAPMTDDEHDYAATSPLVRYAVRDAVATASAFNGTCTGACGVQQAPLSWGQDRVDDTLGLDGRFLYGCDGVAPSGGAGADVFVLDTGIDTGHDEFAGRATWGPDFTGEGAFDGHGHGTHVAATAAGATYGVAKAARVVAVKVLRTDGSGMGSWLLDALAWVAGAAAGSGRPAVVNLSLGFGLRWSPVDDAVNALVAEGVAVAVAAGNDDRRACQVSPARAAAALTVAASTSADARASFSNFGSCVDLFAPGADILSAWPWPGTDATATLSGTSMAAPHVAGALAVVRGERPDLGADEASASLVDTATRGVIADAGQGTPNRLLHVPCPLYVASRTPSVSLTRTPSPSRSRTRTPTPSPVVVASASATPSTSPPADACLGEPCENGGTCTASGGGFACECLEGFSGVYCESAAPSPSPVGCDGEGASQNAPCEDGDWCTSGDRCRNRRGTLTCTPGEYVCAASVSQLTGDDKGANVPKEPGAVTPPPPTDPPVPAWVSVLIIELVFLALGACVTAAIVVYVVRRLLRRHDARRGADDEEGDVDSRSESEFSMPTSLEEAVRQQAAAARYRAAPTGPRNSPDRPRASTVRQRASPGERRKPTGQRRNPTGQRRNSTVHGRTPTTSATA